MKKKLSILVIILSVSLIIIMAKIYSNKSHITNVANTTNVQNNAKSNEERKNNSEDINSFQDYIKVNSIIIDYINFNRGINSTEGYVAYNKGKERTPYIMIYDFKTNKVIKEIKINKVEGQRFYATEDGICRIITGADNKSEVYDNKLNFIKNVDLSKITNIDGFREGIISNDFKTIGFIENDIKYSYLYTSDADYSNKNCILKIKNSVDKPYDLGGITDLGFNDSKDKIVFLGYTYPQTGYDVESVQCFGSIDLNTKKIIKYTGNKVEIQLSTKNMLVSDMDVEYKKLSSGKVNIVDFKGKKTEYTLKDNNESENAFISRGGKYIVTFYQVDKSKTKDYPVIIRVYDVETKKMIKEINTTFNGNYINNSLNNKDSIAINENLKKIYINYWDEKKQSIYDYSFN